MIWYILLGFGLAHLFWTLVGVVIFWQITKAPAPRRSVYPWPHR